MVIFGKLTRALVLGFCVTAGVPGGAFAAPLQLASHQAVYDLKLESLSETGGLEDVRGRIVLKIEQHCDGLIVNQRMVLELVNVQGGTVISDYVQSTWEDNSGKTMRFDMSNMLNGKTVEKYRGVAKHEKDKTTVTFSEPDKEEMDLPASVIFPGEHTRELLAAATKGKSLLSTKIFDGNGDNGLSDTLAVIGKEKTFADPAKVTEKLDGLKYWPLQISFFDLRERQTEPDYEIVMKMFENGVASDLLLKYQDFTLSGKMKELKFFNTEKCS
ncbi:EipB family protein [Sneathiella sp.]|uniref:EipB family protein n=1 Tax=Sneathiella sp. TaxID=1964365 RepID=UPI003567FCCE